ncbi:MAG: AmmeMemoRadiSam system protein B [Armatimonadetes bacterium]|nr:AmmeMemoRadiSam system protein B [Armatimonadota bacterium]
MGTNGSEHPKLRPLDIRPVVHEGQPLLLLRDPLELSGKAVFIPREVAPILALCDGTRDVAGLAAAVSIRYGWQLPLYLLTDLVEALDDALLLDNERYAQARAAAVSEFRSEPFRQPSLAGLSYPAEPEELRALLHGFEQEAGAAPAAPGVRGLISPHIDYERGGAVYARVWAEAAEAVRAADLVILLGTDHHGGEGEVTLTRQSYATPFGVLPTCTTVVDALAAAIGEDALFAGELFHRDEHSIELAAVWLHYIRGGEPCEVLPVLCGPLRHRQEGGEASVIPRFLEVVAESTRDRQVVVVAAADLAHVGPAFGGAPLDALGKERLRSADDALLAHVCAGDAEGFLEAIERCENANNVCGVSSIYLALRLLGETAGERVAYAVCPADEADTSVVTIGGVLLW